jgi:hypothetical protein
MSFARDAATVRALIDQHLPAARSPEEDLAPLTLGEVVCRMQADRRIAAPDAAAARALLASTASVPASLKAGALAALAAPAVLSPAFWRAFRETAVPMGLALSAARHRLSRDTRRSDGGRENAACPQKPTAGSRGP